MTILEHLREEGRFLNAPCGGNGTCGKCTVLVNGEPVLACQTPYDPNSNIEVPADAGALIMTEGTGVEIPVDPVKSGFLLAVDIGTTTVVAFLLDGTDGAVIASGSLLNPQQPFGADVISRIQSALDGNAETLQKLIQDGLVSLVSALCKEAGIRPADIGVVSVVGNPAMQQLFLGIDCRNLAGVPFAPVLTERSMTPADYYLPVCTNAELLVVPDIAGYIGADTVACMLATGIEEPDAPTLLVDIGTNGEMVLSADGHIVACSTAAGPALEGAKISCGMRGAPGAIDKVWLEDGAVSCHVIGGGEAQGICGSGLIDAVSCYLQLGLINKRGRIQKKYEENGERVLPLADGLYLTQKDIHEFMLAKGAIAAGVELMAHSLALEVSDIAKVLLAGAFGSFLNPENACRTGLLPPELSGRITAVGNAAGSGARRIACSRSEFEKTEWLVSGTEFLELADDPHFMHVFAKKTGFSEVVS